VRFRRGKCPNSFEIGKEAQSVMLFDQTFQKIVQGFQKEEGTNIKKKLQCERKLNYPSYIAKRMLFYLRNYRKKIKFYIFCHSGF
jgi:hypothetical protein